MVVLLFTMLFCLNVWEVSILHDAFCQCKALKEIKLPNTLKEVDGFEGCSYLKKMRYLQEWKE